MMRLVLLSLFASATAAFAPRIIQNGFTSQALFAIDPKKEIGVLPPLGYFEYVH
jgi:hypothetical protein